MTMKNEDSVSEDGHLHAAAVCQIRFIYHFQGLNLSESVR